MRAMPQGSNRREHLKTLLGLGAGASAAAGFGRPVQGPAKAGTAARRAIPPQGVGGNIRHVSHSDLGGRPDSVQIMMNRRHLYVGHMFSNGLTVLDATDPRRLKPAAD